MRTLPALSILFGIFLLAPPGGLSADPKPETDATIERDRSNARATLEVCNALAVDKEDETLCYLTGMPRLRSSMGRFVADGCALLARRSLWFRRIPCFRAGMGYLASYTLPLQPKRREAYRAGLFLKICTLPTSYELRKECFELAAEKYGPAHVWNPVREACSLIVWDDIRGACLEDEVTRIWKAR